MKKATGRQSSKSTPNAAALSKAALPRLVVKFKDDFGLPYQDGIEAQFNQSDRSFWNQLSVQFPGLMLKRLFRAITPAQLSAKIAQAQQRDPTYTGPSLLTYYSLEYPAGTDLLALLKAICPWRIVETAYVESRVLLPPALTPDDEPHFGEQGYLLGGNVGVNAPYAWGKLGAAGAGKGVRFIDIELGWNLEHEDLLDADGNPVVRELVGVNHPYDGWRAHGTSVLGIVLAQDNGRGNIGIAPYAKAAVVSEIIARTEEYDDVADRPNAILSAISRLRFGDGDVLLLEAQYVADCMDDETRFWPAEVEYAVFGALRFAAAWGVVVIEPAGNGRRNLDTEEFVQQVANNDSGWCMESPCPRRVTFNLASRRFKDSGAIMVGGGTSSVPHERWPETNFGKRIDCYAWAENIHALTTREGPPGVYSSGYTDDDAEEHAEHGHDHSFNGTSGAAAIIAGVALVVQSAAKRLLGRRLNPEEMRALLRNPALGVRSSSTGDRIGVMPDLKKILLHLPSLR